LNDIPLEVRRKLKFIPLKTIEDVYRNAMSSQRAGATP
jgi:hypothetical protein